MMAGLEGDDGSHIVKKGMDVVRYSESDIVMKLEDDEGPVGHIDVQFEGYKRSGTAYPAKPTLLGLERRKNFLRDSIFSTQHFEQILDGMFPCKVWKDGDKIMGKAVYTSQASRIELKNLQDEILFKEAYLGIRKHGHSKMKVQLNLRCLDELIRQDTLSCAERGMLIKEIRDYLAFQFKTYQRMMKDAVRFCQREMHRIEEDESIRSLSKERTAIVDEIHELTKTLETKEVLYENIEREYKCQAEAIGKIREDEIIAIRKCNINLLSMLEMVNPDCRELPEIRETIKQARRAMAAISLPTDDNA